jgi:hypothetical protein
MNVGYNRHSAHHHALELFYIPADNMSLFKTGEISWQHTSKLAQWLPQITIAANYSTI